MLRLHVAGVHLGRLSLVLRGARDGLLREGDGLCRLGLRLRLDRGGLGRLGLHLSVDCVLLCALGLLLELDRGGLRGVGGVLRLDRGVLCGDGLRLGVLRVVLRHDGLGLRDLGVVLRRLCLGRLDAAVLHGGVRGVHLLLRQRDLGLVLLALRGVHQGLPVHLVLVDQELGDRDHLVEVDVHLAEHVAHVLDAQRVADGLEQLVSLELVQLEALLALTIELHALGLPRPDVLGLGIVVREHGARLPKRVEEPHRLLIVRLRVQLCEWRAIVFGGQSVFTHCRRNSRNLCELCIGSDR